MLWGNQEKNEVPHQGLMEISEKYDFREGLMAVSA